MTQVSIVYFSGYGHTAKLAQSVAKGIESVGGINVSLIVIDNDGAIKEEEWGTLIKSNAIIFGSPTYMGMVAWQFKKFADASSKVWFNQQWKDKLAAGFTNSASMNGDKENTLRYLNTLAMQHGMLWAGLGMLPSNSKAATRNDLNYLGTYLGLAAQSPSDASTDEGPLLGDLETGKAFGIRIAEITKKRFV